MNEKNFRITYGDNQITMFSDERNDYVNLTEMAKAWKGRKSIRSWLRNKSVLGFLAAWERKNNPNFLGAQLGTMQKSFKRDELSIKYWIDNTNAIGIVTRVGSFAGTYAHKDLAIRFAGYLSPEFELFLVEEIQRLKKVEEQKYSFELLNHEQILYLVRLKEVFKYVAHQEIIEDAHKEVFAAKSGSKNPFAEFNIWRNKVLDLTPQVIDERIKQYCIDNDIPLTSKLLKKTKREKILFLDSYDAVRNAVWDFLQIKGEANALNLANLVGDMIRTEKGEVLRINEDTLFHKKQDLAEFNEFNKQIAEIPIVKSARQLLEYREELKKKPVLTNPFDQTLKGLLSVPPPKKNKT